jgi:hypothetical protein
MVKMRMVVTMSGEVTMAAVAGDRPRGSAESHPASGERSKVRWFENRSAPAAGERVRADVVDRAVAGSHCTSWPSSGGLTAVEIMDAAQTALSELSSNSARAYHADRPLHRDDPANPINSRGYRPTRPIPPCRSLGVPSPKPGRVQTHDRFRKRTQNSLGITKARREFGQKKIEDHLRFRPRTGPRPAPPPGRRGRSGKTCGISKKE